MSSLNQKKDHPEPTYWRSFDQLADTPEFKEFLHREFPENASEMSDPMSRRSFLTIMGASMALAGLTSCRRPVEKIVPYVKPPEEVTPGVPEYFATTMPFGASAYGLVVESHEGRPTKIEGNKAHPSSRGAASSFIQAEILNLYDPDRSQFLLNKGAEKGWPDLVTFWQDLYKKFLATNGAGLAILSEPFSSPTLQRLKDTLEKTFPQAKWVTYEPVSDENIYAGVQAATGRVLQPVLKLENAKTIVALDADFLLLETENLVNARGFANGRRVKSERDDMNRLYVVESAYTITGAMADHRLRLQSRQIGRFAAALALALQKQGLALNLGDALAAVATEDFDREWLRVVAKELLENRGQGLVVAGRRQPAAVHALVFAINAALGNLGKTIDYHEPRDKALPNRSDLLALTKAMAVGEVNTLVMLGGNPVYNAPVESNFAAALKKVEHTLHLNMHRNETSRLCEWHVPAAHFLETWSDARSADGTLSVVQPLIAPLFDDHSTVEFLSLIATGRDLRGYDIVRETWQQIIPGSNFESNWRNVLYAGLLEKTSLPAISPVVNIAAIAAFLTANPLPADTADKNKLEIVFPPSTSVYDGRYANNGWLQELPDPVTKITWDNAALMSLQTAQVFRLQNQDVVALQHNNRIVEVPIWIVPGHADFSISVALGYGQEASGRIGSGVGCNAYPLRSSQAPDFALGVTLSKTSKTHMLATTQDHDSMEGRSIVREATLEEYRTEPEFATEMVEHPPLESLWQEYDYSKGYQWGMSIDLNVCIGCNACTTACQSENNIPIVGKIQVHRGREMHWIRMDRYFNGEVRNPLMVYQPVACQHCENAPCEQVCPVAATVHDQEGLNVMTYNRCIGTRYCSNNCPYKVRRFNFFNFTKDTPEIVKMAMNPDVTVRARGVMEKCSFCLQRINEGKARAKMENRQVRDGEIVTACQQTCPTEAIVFGNLNEPDSQVVQSKKQNRNYGLLAEFNVKPRNSYLAKLRNPNKELAKVTSEPA